MRIGICTNQIAGGWHPDDLNDFLGGNEEAVVRLASGLSGHGHKVTVITSLREETHVLRDSVAYHQYGYWPEEPFDILIATKNHEALSKIESSRKIYWCVDIEHPWDTSKADTIVILGNYMAARLLWLRHPDIRMIPYGINKKDFEPAPQRDENLAIYTTSPDRGLETLLSDWRVIKQQRPDLRLMITYGWRNIENMSPGLKAFRGRIEMLSRQPDIEMRQVSQKEMRDLFCTAKWWVHPLNNPDSDLIGFSAMKAREGGCIPVIPGPIGGLGDAVPQYVDYRQWVNGGDLLMANPLAIGLMAIPSWESIVDQWNDLILEG